ncbi:MAG: putative CRISPR-associated protein [Desulfosoma sp.]
MAREILCTVGTSLLTNRDDRPWGGWSPRDGRPLPEPDLVDDWLQSADLRTASAETNTLSRLDIVETDVLAFLHSETEEGKFCAERLKSFYGTRAWKVDLEKISRLGYGAYTFTAGLKALVDVTIRRVHKAYEAGRHVLFFATGGFKAEIAFLNLVGALLGIEVVYIHELHHELVRLPRLPLSWDPEFVEQHKDFFNWIDEEPRKSTEVESWLQARPDLRSLVEDADDGYTYLSAAGDLLFKVARERIAMGPRVTWPKADPRPPAAKNQVSTVEHHRPPGWEHYVARLCAIDCVTAVRYDPRARSGSRVKVLDPQNGVVGATYGDTENCLPLRIETTARGARQTEMVAEHIRGLK